jgi:hypothetical protein
MEESNIHIIFDLFLKLDTFFSFTLNLLLKSFHTFIHDLDSYTLQNIPEISLDTNMNFELFDIIKPQNPFDKINETFKSLYRDENPWKETPQSHEQDLHNQLLSLIQSLPNVQKNLISAYIEAHIQYKTTATQKVSNHLKLFSKTLTKLNDLTNNFLQVYFTSLGNEKKYIKTILKGKIKDYLKSDYILFLNDLKEYLKKINNLEKNLKIEKKEFNTELDKCLIETKLYVKELKSSFCNRENTFQEKSVMIDEEQNKNKHLNQHLQMHELNKWKQDLVENSSKNFSSSLMILKEMEEDLILISPTEKDDDIELFCDTKKQNGLVDMQNDKLQQIELLEKQNEHLTFILLKHKEAMKEIIKQTYKEFIKRLNLEKVETIKILLNEFTPYLNEKENELKQNKMEAVNKLQFQESLLFEVLKEIDEQKKQFKDLSIKLDLCVKLLKEETLQALKKFQFISFQTFYSSTLDFLKVISGGD